MFLFIQQLRNDSVIIQVCGELWCIANHGLKPGVWEYGVLTASE